MAQETDISRGFQVVQVLRVGAVLAVEKLDGALVLFAAVDEQLLALALRFEGDSRHLHVQRDGDGRAQYEDQEQRETGLFTAFHPCISASSGSVCCVLLPLKVVSSTTAEFTPMRTIL